MQKIQRASRLLASYWDNPEVARTLEICSDLEIMGLGARRIVVAGEEGYVYKIPWREGGVVDNETEYRLWHYATKDLQALLCPTEEITDQVTKQRRCLPLSWEALGEGSRGMLGELHRWGISDVAVNLGQLDGQIVCYDYALLRSELWQKLFSSGVP